MTERGGHHGRSDVYTEYKSRDKGYSHNGDHATYDARGHNQKPRDMDKRGSAGGRRAKENRQRDITTAPDVEPPSYRNHNHDGPSRL